MDQALFPKKGELGHGREREKTMFLHESAGCCGLGELYNLDGDQAEGNDYYTGWPCDNVAEALKEASTEKFGAVFATTVSSQAGAIAELKKNGFKAKERFHNPKTGRKVTLWWRDISKGDK